MIRREVSFFILNGTVSVILAYLIYRELVTGWGLGINWSNGIAYICGLAYGFFANRKWAFQYSGLNTRKTITLYVFLHAFTLFVNISVNSTVLLLTHGMRGDILLSFLVAISISTILNFLGLKYFVFNRNRKRFVGLRKTREDLP